MRNNTAVSHWRSRNKSNQKHKQNGSSPVAGVANGNDEEFEAEQIMDKRVSISGRQVHYLVKWKGYPLDESTWEPPANLVNCKELIREYERAHAHEAHSHRPVTPLSASQRKRNRRSTAKTTGIGESSKRRDGGSASGAGTGTESDTSTEPPPAKRAVSEKLTSERDSDRGKKLESEAEKFPEVIGTTQGQGSENNPDKSAEEKLPEPETMTEEERSSKLQSPSNVVCSNGGVEEEEEEEKEVLSSDHNKVDTCDQKDDVIKVDTELNQRAMSELRIPVNGSENISTENDESKKSENHDRNLNTAENNDDGKGEVNGGCSDIDDNNNTNNSINNSDNISDGNKPVSNDQERLPQVQTSVAPQHSEEPEDVPDECESKIMEVVENGSAETQAEQPESERSEEQTKNPSNTSEEERLAGVSRILRITEMKHENGHNESEKNDAVAYDVEFKNGSCECLSWSAVHTYLKDHLIEFYERQLKIRQ